MLATVFAEHFGIRRPMLHAVQVGGAPARHDQCWRIIW